MEAKRVLKMVAKRNGVSLKEVRKEIQEAINYAWKDMPEGGEELRKKVPCRGEVPTPEELICFLSNEARVAQRRKGSVKGCVPSGWQALPEEGG